jgi:hypothetical protein
MAWLAEKRLTIAEILLKMAIPIGREEPVIEGLFMLLIYGSS